MGTPGDGVREQLGGCGRDHEAWLGKCAPPFSALSSPEALVSKSLLAQEPYFAFGQSDGT